MESVSKKAAHPEDRLWSPSLPDIEEIHRRIRLGDVKLEQLWNSLHTELTLGSTCGSEKENSVEECACDQTGSPFVISGTKEETFESLANASSPVKYTATYKRRRRSYMGPVKEIAPKEDVNKIVISPGFNELKRLFSEIAADSLLVDDGRQKIAATKPQKQKPAKLSGFAWPSRKV